MFNQVNKMKQVSPSDLKKILNSQLQFTPSTYSTCDNQQSYLTDLLNHTLIRRKLTTSICLNELNEVLRDLSFDLTNQQMHQLYLYCTFETGGTRVTEVVNQERKRVDERRLVEWIMRNMTGLRLRARSLVAKERSRQERVGFRENRPRLTLPKIKRSGSSKLKNELEPLIEIFDEMEKLRRNSGLIPMKMQQDEDDDVEIPSMYIPYDPQLYDLNLNLSKLRIKAQQQLKKIVEMSAENPEIRKKIEFGIEKFQKNRIEKNEKIGRTGAINAQRRLAQQRYKQAARFKQLNLSMDGDLVRAAKVYSLLNSPNPKIKPVF